MIVNYSFFESLFTVSSPIIDSLLQFTDEIALCMLMRVSVQVSKLIKQYINTVTQQAYHKIIQQNTHLCDTNLICKMAEHSLFTFIYASLQLKYALFNINTLSNINNVAIYMYILYYDDREYAKCTSKLKYHVNSKTTIKELAILLVSSYENINKHIIYQTFTNIYILSNALSCVDQYLFRKQSESASVIYKQIKVHKSTEAEKLLKIYLHNEENDILSSLESLFT